MSFLREPTTFLQHLDKRSLLGSSPTPYRGIQNKYTRRLKKEQQLFATGAWNLSRMQNMTLAVGPGSPAYELNKNADTSVDNSDSADIQLSNDSSFDSEGEFTLDENDHLSVERHTSARPREARSDIDVADVEESSNVVMQLISNDVDLFQAASVDDTVRQSLSTMFGSQAVESILPDRLGSLTNTARPHTHASSQKSSYKSSIRHDGCINTACWLDVPWRLSTVSNGTSTSLNIVNEFNDPHPTVPTQILTSGDDKMINAWDLYDAMGVANPLPGGWNTLLAYSGPDEPEADYLNEWKRYYRNNPMCKQAGLVKKLASYNTSHHLNVFDVVADPVNQGRLYTCAADGFFRMYDMNAEKSIQIYNPIMDDAQAEDARGYFGMSYMSLQTSAFTGFICHSRGLLRYDTRLSPNEHSSDCVINLSRFARSKKTCKQCVAWSPYSSNDGDGTYNFDSNYFVAGGLSSSVVLFDIRSVGLQSNSKDIVDVYCPVNRQNAHVAVSGITLSKDKKRLLVSYIDDHIYEFTIRMGMEGFHDEPRHDDKSSDKHITHHACYGGHVNKHTMLKQAKYAGPNDEYICTGSDKGLAWIYEAKTGTIASIFSGDRKTCNGVIPHPTLPFFITYGLDSSAKIYRATCPVDINTDDSKEARMQTCMKRKDICLPVDILSPKNCVGYDVLPQTVPDRENDFPARNEMQMMPHAFHSILADLVPGLNAVNYSWSTDCVIKACLIRLRHYANCLGLSQDPNKPWKFIDKRGLGIEAADMIPLSTSDWLCVDPLFCKRKCPLLSVFDSKRYREELELLGYMVPEVQRSNATSDYPWLANDKPIADQIADGTDANESGFCIEREVLCKTMKVLKDAGNKALSDNNLNLAGCRYNKAHFLASLIMARHLGVSLIAKVKLGLTSEELPIEYFTTNPHAISWSTITKLIMQLHLNMSLHALKAKDLQTSACCALDAASYMCQFKVKDHATNDSKYVTKEEWDEIRPLLAKAHFRVGCAFMEQKKDEDALSVFKRSLEFTDPSEANAVKKKIREIKLRTKAANDKQRKNLQGFFK